MSREDERKYRADVDYEVWRSGHNPDNIDYDRVSESFWDGLSPEQAACREMRRRDRTFDESLTEVLPTEDNPEEEFPE